MNLKIIGGVNYKEVEDLIRKTEVKPKIEKRGKIFRRKLYEVYPSPNQEYVLAFKYLGELRIASHYYNLILETKDRKILKDFRKRFFFCDYYRYGSPWIDNNRFILLEIKEKPENESIERLIIHDINKDNEIAIASAMIVKPSLRIEGEKYILFETSNRSGIYETKILNLITNEVIILPAWVYPQNYIIFFDKEAKYIITLNQLEEKSELKILSFPNLEPLFSKEIDMNIILSSIQRVIPKVKQPFWYLKEFKRTQTVKDKKENKFWYQVVFDQDKNILYLGIQREEYLYQEDYYRSIEWLKAELEF